LSSCRGQIFANDLIVGAFLFMVALAILVSGWEIARLRMSEKAALADMESKAYRAADTLVSRRGAPFDWEERPIDVVRPGLALFDRTLSANKVRALPRLDEKTLSEALGVGAYKIRVSVNGMDGALVAATPGFDCLRNRVSAQRIASLEGEGVFVGVTLCD
jgi:hypothetical protein